MKRIRASIFMLHCLAMVFAMLVSSCADESRGGLSVMDNPTGTMVIRMRLDVAGFPTRSAEGIENRENEIDGSDVWIATFSGSGKIIDILCDVDSRHDGSLNFETVVDGSDYRDTYFIVALANWSAYGVGPDELREIRNIQDLAGLHFTMPHDTSSARLLPMVGVSEEHGAAGDGAIVEPSIAMERALAKIEVRYMATENAGLKSVRMPGAAAGGRVLTEKALNVLGQSAECGSDAAVSAVIFKSVVLNKESVADMDTGSDKNITVFQTYVPAMSLDEPGSDDSNRQVMLDMDDGSTRIINIGENVAIPGTEGEQGCWTSLQNNNLYRIVITGDAVESSRIPTILPGTTIRICFFTPQTDTHVGRYTRKNKYLFLYRNATDKLGNNVNTNYRASNSPTAVIDGTKYNDGYHLYWEYEIGEDDNYKEMIYLLTENSQPSNDATYRPQLRNLMNDVVWYQEVGDIMECWLTSMPVRDKYNLDSDIYPTDKTYRVYWHGDRTLEYACAITTSPGKLINIADPSVKFDERRQFNYMEFTLLDKVKSLSIDISYRDSYNKLQGLPYIPGLKTTNVFVEEIPAEDNKEYYVIYAY